MKMKEEEGCSWEEISDALPSRTPGPIRVRYSTKLGGGTGSRKRRRLDKRGCHLIGYFSEEKEGQTATLPVS